MGQFTGVLVTGIFVAGILAAGSHARRRQMQRYAGALSNLALQLDMAVMGFRQALDDGEAQAGALFGDGDVVLALSETVKHLGLILGRDARTGIADPQRPAAVRMAGGKNRDLAVLGRELCGVGQKIEQDLLDGALIGINRRKA